jgi:hypothetical protein
MKRRSREKRRERPAERRGKHLHYVENIDADEYLLG